MFLQVLTHLLQVKHYLHSCFPFFKTCCRRIFLASISCHSFLYKKKKINFSIHAIHHGERVSANMFSSKVCYFFIGPSFPLVSRTECNNILSVSGLNASSFWDTNSQEHAMFWSSRNMGSSHDFQPWAAGRTDLNPWVELQLSDRSTITGKKRLN